MKRSELEAGRGFDLIVQNAIHFWRMYVKAWLRDLRFSRRSWAGIVFSDVTQIAIGQNSPTFRNRMSSKLWELKSQQAVRVPEGLNTDVYLIKYRPQVLRGVNSILTN
jgi:hypothetical protein